MVRDSWFDRLVSPLLRAARIRGNQERVLRGSESLESETIRRPTGSEGLRYQNMEMKNRYVVEEIACFLDFIFGSASFR